MPALDVYTIDPPDAAGKRENVERQPAPRFRDLDPAAARQLSRSRDGRTLAAIATAPELGADPGVRARAALAGGTAADTDTADPSPLTAVAQSFIDPVPLAVLVGLAGLGALFFLRRHRRRDV